MLLLAQHLVPLYLPPFPLLGEELLELQLQPVQQVVP